MMYAPTGRKLSKEHKEKISKALLGKKHTEATKKKTSESLKGKKHTEATKKRISESQMGHKHTDATKKKMSAGHKGKKFSEAHKKKLSEAHKGQTSGKRGKKLSVLQRKRMSATAQGIPYDEWEAFVKDKPYCPLFNEACRESNRAKYNYECFICGKPQSENVTKTGKVRKLSVHHIDMDKNQGCDGHRWKLIPTCMKCHPGTHNAEIIARLEYLCSIDNKEK